MSNLPVLSEQWLPIETIGAECMRERGASSALPPLYFFHVWWARRPLTVSRAAILGSVLPVWSPDWPKSLRLKFPTEDSYRKWFLELIGIYGDPVAGRRLLQKAIANKKPIANPYGYDRAFTKNPGNSQIATLRELLAERWGNPDVSICDPMAGGGSIPFEGIRFGFRVFANELNSVASVILKATLDYPARFGPELAVDIRRWGGELHRRVQSRLSGFFSKLPPNAIGGCYIWARTVACPVTGKLVPLSPNWWLQTGPNPVAVKLIAKPEDKVCRFQIVTGNAAEAARPDAGTVKKGVGKSPWTGDAIDSDYIKREAQAGRMGQQLYAVAIKSPGGFAFRTPTEDDFAAVKAAENELALRLPDWEARGLVPREHYPEHSTDPRPILYGMPTWADFFSPRQLLSLLTILDEMLAIRPEIVSACGKGKIVMRTHRDFTLFCRGRQGVASSCGLAPQGECQWYPVGCTAA